MMSNTSATSWCRQLFTWSISELSCSTHSVGFTCTCLTVAYIVISCTNKIFCTEHLLHKMHFNTAGLILLPISSNNKREQVNHKFVPRMGPMTPPPNIVSFNLHQHTNLNEDTAAGLLMFLNTF